MLLVIVRISVMISSLLLLKIALGISTANISRLNAKEFARLAESFFELKSLITSGLNILLTLS